MKNTTTKGRGKGMLSPAKQLADFRRYLESAFARYTGDAADPTSRTFFNELTDLLCLSFEDEGFEGAREVIAEVGAALKAKAGGCKR